MGEGTSSDFVLRLITCKNLLMLEICCYTILASDSFPWRLVFSHKLEMWASAQRDGCPGEYSWRPVFNAAKFGWRPLLECRAVTLPRRETCWNLQGCPKLANRSQRLVGQCSSYCHDVCGRHCCLTSFFLMVDTCLSCEDIAQQTCAMVPRWRLFGSFLG